MITSAISSAARLSLAPARLAGRMAGSLLRGLRGNDAGDTSSARSSARTTPARRSRAKTQTKRAATRSSAKAQPKRTPARARPKSQASAARSKRTAARARPKSQASAARSKRTSGPEPLGDVAIAREVESTIFRDLEIQRGQVDVGVAEGVVRLRGEVGTPDLINELEVRAARVPQVRRVENLVRTPAPPPETATPAAQQVDPASTLGKTSAPPGPALPTRDLAAAAQETGAAPAETPGAAPEPRAGRPAGYPEPPTGAPEGASEPALERREGDASADHDEAGPAEPDKDPSYQPKDPEPHGLEHG